MDTDVIFYEDNENALKYQVYTQARSDHLLSGIICQATDPVLIPSINRVGWKELHFLNKGHKIYRPTRMSYVQMSRNLCKTRVTTFCVFTLTIAKDQTQNSPPKGSKLSYNII